MSEVENAENLEVSCPVEALPAALEAILMIVSEPASEEALAAAVNLPTPLVHQTLGDLAQEYRQAKRGFILRQVAGGWRFYADPAYGNYLVRFNRLTSSKLSPAAIETLAIIAYKQPCTRAQVAAVRGVNADSVIRSLLARELIEVCGTGASGASLYQTTSAFLEQCGLQSLADLPPLAPYLPQSDEVEALANQIAPAQQASLLAELDNPAEGLGDGNTDADFL